ncbi:hypothetical protein Scani_46600 [Streptomyces caniferus]|uniref:Uncharacterized protein n=1 Tax=Streptomyces caniferus TaxID=285557 RepID=A0A640SD30_9ACTN|nr:hypothetical protein Scani_46600 [Streptomyces caniferus]
MLGGADSAYIPDESRCADRVAAPARPRRRAPDLPAARPSLAAQEDAAGTRPARTASLSAW